MSSPRIVHIPTQTLDDLGTFLNEAPGGDCFAWFDADTGGIIQTASLYGMDPDDSPDEDEPEGAPPGQTGRTLHPWMEEERRQVAAICLDQTGRYIRVPVGSEHGEPGVLRDFVRSLTDDTLRAEVQAATHGRGAFRNVKEVLQRRDQIELWRRFEDERRRSCALESLRSEGIEPA